jgi:hypothetical protein
MAAAIGAALENSTVIQQMASGAQKRIRTLCDPDKCLLLLDDVYRKALRESRKWDHILQQEPNNRNLE